MWFYAPVSKSSHPAKQTSVSIGGHSLRLHSDNVSKSKMFKAFPKGHPTFFPRRVLPPKNSPTTLCVAKRTKNQILLDGHFGLAVGDKVGLRGHVVAHVEQLLLRAVRVFLLGVGVPVSGVPPVPALQHIWVGSGRTADVAAGGGGSAAAAAAGGGAGAGGAVAAGVGGGAAGRYTAGGGG